MFGSSWATEKIGSAAESSAKPKERRRDKETRASGALRVGVDDQQQRHQGGNVHQQEDAAGHVLRQHERSAYITCAAAARPAASLSAPRKGAAASSRPMVVALTL